MAYSIAEDAALGMAPPGLASATCDEGQADIDRHIAGGKVI